MEYTYDHDRITTMYPPPLPRMQQKIYSNLNFFAFSDYANLVGGNINTIKKYKL
jgi:hypothetical protein